MAPPRGGVVGEVGRWGYKLPPFPRYLDADSLPPASLWLPQGEGLRGRLDALEVPGPLVLRLMLFSPQQDEQQVRTEKSFYLYAV